MSILLPANVTFGTVTGRFGSATMVPGDPDGVPDFTPPVGLKITFTPAVPAVIDATATPSPVMIEMVPIACTINSDGYLIGGDGNPGVNLVATNNPALNPTNWTYKVSFTRDSLPLKAFPDFSMAVPAGQTVDLNTVVPVPSSAGLGLTQAKIAEAAATLAASTATLAANTASAAAAAASTSATNAATSASSMSSSVSSASASATAASASATAAATSATNAAASATSAATSATNAATSASGAASAASSAVAAKADKTYMKDYIASRGVNLVTNGTAMLGDNTNFTNFTLLPDHPTGASGSFSPVSKSPTSFLLDDLIPVEPTRTYESTFWYRQVAGDGTRRFYSLVAPFDVDKLSIQPYHYMEQTGTRTTLAVTLSPGATTITLTSAAGWNNAAGGANGYLRSLLFWNYTDGKGYTWPVGTYSRNYYSDMYADGGISGNVITLRTAWTGPTIAAGTAVSNGTSGASYLYGANNVLGPSVWTPYGPYRYSGIHTSNTTPATTAFPQATVYVKYGYLLNYPSGATDSTAVAEVANVGFREVPSTVTTPGDLPSGAFAQTIPRWSPTGNQTPTSGRLTLTLIYIPQPATVSTIRFVSGATALSGGSHGWAALYNSDLTLLGQSANDTSITWAANTSKTFTLTTPVQVQAGLYYVGINVVATTMPSLAGLAQSFGVAALPPHRGGLSTASLTSTAPDPAAAISTTTTQILYAYLT